MKVWFEEKGFGFITPNDNSGDAFVHRTAIQDVQSLVQGTPVKFQADWDYQKSRAMARVVYCAGTPMGAPAGPAGGAAPAAAAAGAGGGPASIGTVKVWFDDKGFGFIAPADGSADVFVHRSHLLDGQLLTQGASVRFDANWDFAKGKFIASRVCGANHAGQPPAAGGGGYAPPAPPAAHPGGQVVAPPTAVEEVIISGLPATSTPEFVAGIFGPYGTIVSCEMVPGTPQGAAVKLKMATAAQAQWLVTNLNGNMPVGLETPVYIGFAKTAATASANRYAPY